MLIDKLSIFINQNFSNDLDFFSSSIYFVLLSFNKYVNKKSEDNRSYMDMLYNTELYLTEQSYNRQLCEVQ